MIQRIQTVYLASAALLLALFVVLDPDLASVSGQEGTFRLTAVSVLVDNAEGTVLKENAFPIAGAVALALLLTAYGIMQYRSRKFQMRLVQGAMVVQLAICGAIFFYADRMGGMAGAEAADYGLFVVVPLINVGLYMLANRAIRKDEELVRSADRLR